MDAPIRLRQQPNIALGLTDELGVTVGPDPVVDVPGSDSHLRSL
jgi:hypothetical protein